MNVTLSLHALLRNTNQEADLTARLPEERGGASAKGDAVIIGQVVLMALSFRHGRGVVAGAESVHEPIPLILKLR